LSTEKSIEANKNFKIILEDGRTKPIIEILESDILKDPIQYLENKLKKFNNDNPVKGFNIIILEKDEENKYKIKHCSKLIKENFNIILVYYNEDEYKLLKIKKDKIAYYNISNDNFNKLYDAIKDKCPYPIITSPLSVKAAVFVPTLTPTSEPALIEPATIDPASEPVLKIDPASEPVLKIDGGNKTRRRKNDNKNISTHSIKNGTKKNKKTKTTKRRGGNTATYKRHNKYRSSNR